MDGRMVTEVSIFLHINEGPFVTGRPLVDGESFTVQIHSDEKVWASQSRITLYFEDPSQIDVFAARLVEAARIAVGADLLSTAMWCDPVPADAVPKISRGGS